MTYSTLENSEQDGKPVELYKFVVGSTTYLYTSAQEEVESTTNNGLPETYLPLEIGRTSPEQSKELQRTALTLTVPRDADIANNFVAFLPSELIFLTIYRQHDGNPTEFIRMWAGRVKSVSWKESIAEIECNPRMMSLKRQGLRKDFGASCQHTLYDGGCGVLKADFETEVLISDVDGAVLTGTGEITATADADWFVTGYAQRANGEIRFVVDQSGDTVTLLVPFTGLLAGETISVFAGCKRDIDTCFVKFNTDENEDAENFFGFHVNPKKNPFVTGLQ